MHKRKPSPLSWNGIERPNVKPKQNSLTLSWNEIPEWQRDNEYILSGYRPVQNRWSGCVASIFDSFHNETVNIHSHFWGAILFVLLLATFQTRHVAVYETTTWVDTCAIAVFLMSAVFCLSASATFHASTCHSQQVRAKCHVLDYIGIIVLTVGSFVPCIVYGFFCDPLSQACHLLAIAFAGGCATYVVLNPEYAKPTHRGARTGVFVTLGLYAVVPVTQLVTRHGAMRVFSEMGFGWQITSGILYISGALVYANRIPERIAPGKFDYFFASHQIFHVCVVMAALTHWSCVLAVLEHRHSELDGVCDA
ncbi:hemolysin-III related-domain-containing protein [Boletus coccyginus]|nr:hemolysin-III related-domain-containing protein [Boletus coccyginus]